MKFSTMAWLLGSTLVVAAGGVGAAACSSGGNGTPGGGTDSGTGGDTSQHNDTGTPPNDTGTPPGDTGTPPPGDGGGGDCGSFPTLHAGMAGSLYCPFGPGDGGAPIMCGAGQECCISGKVGMNYPPSTCAPLSDGGTSCMFAAMTGNTYIECEDPSTDCAGGSVCCASPTPAPVPGCGYDKLVGWQYSRCEVGTACAAGEVQICAAATGQCPMGQSCQVFKAKGIDLGFCM